jgi:hypothetical protein
MWALVKVAVKVGGDDDGLAVEVGWVNGVLELEQMWESAVVFFGDTGGATDECAMSTVICTKVDDRTGV